MAVRRPASSQPLPGHARKAFSGKIFDVYQWEQRLFDGTSSTFEKVRRPDTVIVFPVLADGRILITHEEQPGKRPFIGTVAGIVDAGESPAETARRELIEETGMSAEHLELWDARQPIPKIEWAVFTFIARGLREVRQPAPEAGERIATEAVTLDELLDLAADPRFGRQEIVPRLYAETRTEAARRRLRDQFSVRPPGDVDHAD